MYRSVVQLSSPQFHEVITFTDNHRPMPAVPPTNPLHQGSRQRAPLSPSEGNAGRRSVRMDPRLHDQENSGEADMEMMRADFEAVRMRYDETQQGDVMDETPPRIGRVERHM